MSKKPSLKALVPKSTDALARKDANLPVKGQKAYLPDVVEEAPVPATAQKPEWQKGMRTITCWLPQRHYVTLKQACAEHGITTKEFVTQAVEKHLRDLNYLV